MFSNNTYFSAYYPNKLYGCKGRARVQKIFEGELVGTTPSGHPNKTTLGNTLRMVLSFGYAASTVGLKYKDDFMIFQSGDDTLILISEGNAGRIKEAIHTLWKCDGEVCN